MQQHSRVTCGGFFNNIPIWMKTFGVPFRTNLYLSAKNIRIYSQKKVRASGKVNIIREGYSYILVDDYRNVFFFDQQVHIARQQENLEDLSDLDINRVKVLCWMP